MSGPIVRTGATPEFWSNWDNVFGDKKTGTGASKKKVTGKSPAPAKAEGKTTSAKVSAKKSAASKSTKAPAAKKKSAKKSSKRK